MNARRRSALGALGMVAATAIVLQLVSATSLVRDFETPNASTRIARTLAATGAYALPVGADRAWRAFQLPGEPLYLAAAFRFLPQSFGRYLHVPIAVLFAVAVAAVAFALGGRSLAIVAGLLASLDPFVVTHGPVWDDTFLAAALEWSVIALLMSRLAAPSEDRRPAWPVMLAMFVCAGVAAVTRLQSQLVLGAVAAGVVIVPALRPIRALGWMIGAGAVLSVGLWAARNYLVLGSLLLGSTHDGQTFLQSNYPGARAAIVQTGVTETFVDLTASTSLDEVALDAQYRDAAEAYFRSHPGDAALTSVIKIGVSLTGLDFAAPVTSARNLVAAGANVALLIFAAAGFRSWRRRTPRSALASCVTLAGAASAVVTLLLLAVGPVGLRYRIGFAGFLYLGAAYALLGARRTGEGVTA